MVKTFVEGMPGWTSEELVFNVVAWHKGYRFFGGSKDLLKVRMRPEKENPGFTLLRTSLVGETLNGEIDKMVRMVQ